MKIIGAGFGRTGTMSMKLALEQLGFGPCYHMKEVFAQPSSIPLWHKVAHGHEIEWNDILGEYNSGVDWPLSHFWEPLSLRYPDAQILLTVRPADEWYTSMSNTILNVLAGKQPEGAMQEIWKEMTEKIVRTDTFDGRTDNRAYCESVFNQHIEYVKEAVPKGRLIIYEVGSGWKPLCDALGVSVPESPFPKTNTTKEFQSNKIEEELKENAK